MNWIDEEKKNWDELNKQIMKIISTTGPLPPLKIDYKAPDSPGGRDDGGKVRYDLIPPEALEGLAKVLTFGANKYADRNWEKGMDWSRVYGSLMRHLWTWWDTSKEDVDDETRLSHLAHALTNVAFLITYETRKVGNDNRPRL